MLKWGTKRVLIAATIISAAYQILVWQALYPAAMHHFAESLRPALGRVLYRSVIGGLSCFVAGMAAARLVIHPQPNQSKWAALVCVLVAPYCIWGYLLQSDQEGGSVPVHHVALGLFFSALIVIIAGHEASKAASEAEMSPLRRITNPVWTFITWVGGFSYSLYLIHHPILKLMKPYTQAVHLPRVEVLLLFLVTGLPIIVAVSYFFFLCFEKPFIGAKRRRQLDHQEPAEVPPVEPQAVAVANSSAS
jgi:peptidoglycan/LPS O-acetylase OafA/YrhL